MIAYFIKKSVFTICLNLAILLIGIFSIPKMASEFIPMIKVPAVAVILPTTLHSTDNIFEFVTKPLEEAFLKTELIERVETRIESQKNISVIYCKWKFTPEQCLQRSRQIVDGLKQVKGVLDPIFILHQPSLSPIFRMVVFGKSPEEITPLLKQPIQDLERISGIASVKMQGASPQISKIDVDLSRATFAGINIENILSSAIKIWGFRTLLTTADNKSTLLQVKMESTADLNNMPVINSSGNKIELRSIAKIQDSSLSNDLYYGSHQKAVIIEILKAPGKDTLSIVDEAQKVLVPFFKNNPQILHTVIYDESVEIRNAQAGVLSNFAVGIILNSFVLIIFLGSFVGVIIASAIFPTAILGTLYILNSLDISLNIFSLNGFSLAAGMITDASTVVLESVMRRIQNKENSFLATINGTKDVMLGIVAGTASSAAVMIPICLQSGMSAKLFSDLGITLIGTQILTLISVFSLVPFLCFKFLNGEIKTSSFVGWIYTKSSTIVSFVSKFCLQIFEKSENNLSIRIGIPFLFAFLCFGSFIFLPPSELLPVVSSNTYIVSVPVNRSALSFQYKEKTQSMAKILGQNNHIEWAVTSYDEDTIQATIKTKIYFNKIDLTKKLSAALNVKEDKITLFPVGPTPPSESMSFDGLVYLSKKIPQTLMNQLVSEFCKSKAIKDCLSEEHYLSPRMVLSNKSILTQQFSMDPISLSLEMNLRMNLLNLSTVASLATKNPIFLDSKISNMVSDSPLMGGNEKPFRILTLGSFFEKESDITKRSIFTQNLETYTPVFFKLDKNTLGEAEALINELAQKFQINPEMILPVSTLASMNETFSKILLALMISLILNFGILLLQFRSLKQTLIVMFAIPLSLGGAISGLIVMNETVNVGVLVGFMLLGGIVVNNGILLFENLNQLLESGVDFRLAMKESIKNRTRPILMTSCATIFGMMPTLLFESSGQELYRGMAIVNIFGMALGTFLTLLVLPLIYRMTTRVS